MPLPNPYRLYKDNIDTRTGYHRQAFYDAGRTSWSGNQRRPYSRFEPPTACSSVTLRYNTETFKRVFNNGVREGWLPYVYNSGKVVSVTTNPSKQDEADAKAVAMRRFSANTGFAETVAETPSAVRLIGRRAGLIYNILRIAGKGRFKEAGQILSRATGYNVSNRSIKRLERKFGESKFYDSRRASSFWLEYQFGFAPLFQSVYDSLNHFAHERRRYDKRGTVNGAKFGISASVENRELFDAARMGVTNPALLAWNLLPFSFVVDWFLPIGTALAWISSNQGLGPVYAWSSTEKKRVQTIDGIFWSERLEYRRSVERKPDVTALFQAGPRSHGLWTVITTLSLVNNLR